MPFLGSLIAMLGALYALYLLYLGLMRVMKSPPDKAVGYTVVVVVVAIVVGFVVNLVAGAFGLGRTDACRMLAINQASPAGGSGSQKLAMNPIRYATVPTMAPA